MKPFIIAGGIIVGGAALYAGIVGAMLCLAEQFSDEDEDDFGRNPIYGGL